MVNGAPRPDSDEEEEEEKEEEEGGGGGGDAKTSHEEDKTHARAKRRERKERKERAKERRAERNAHICTSRLYIIEEDEHSSRGHHLSLSRVRSICDFSSTLCVR